MRELSEKNKMRTGICIAIAILIAGVSTGMLMERRIWKVEAKMAAMQQKLADEVLRFHVLANSDSEEDQKLKMKVKESVISYMKKQLPDAGSVEETKQWTGDHVRELEAVAQEVIEKEGYDYSVEAKLTTSYFPDKTYGDVTFPAGNYEALRIEIGQAKGQNWWCVLYPNLCFIDAVHAVVPEEGKQELEAVLQEDEYEMVTATSKFKIKWFFFGEDMD